MDFAVYYRAAERLRDGVDLYRSGPEGAFAYPPFAAWVFVPLTVVPLRAAQWFWGALQGAALVAVVHLALRLSRREWASLTKTQLKWLIAVVTLMCLRHLHSPLENSQTDLVVVALCFWGAVWLQEERTQWWAGIPLAAAVGMKAVPLLFLPFLLRWRQWKAAAVLVVVAVLLNVLPSIQFPSEAGQWHGRQWIDAMAKPALESGPAANRPGVWGETDIHNQALGGLLIRLFVKGGSDRGILLALDRHFVGCLYLILVGILLVISGFVRRGRWCGCLTTRLTPTAYDVATVIVLMLLFSPKTSKAHLCSLSLPIILLTTGAIRSPKSWSSILWFIIAITMGLLTKEIIGKPAANWLLNYGYLTWFMLFILAYLWLGRTPTEAVQSQATDTKSDAAH